MSKTPATDDVAVAWSRMCRAAGPSYTPKSKAELEKPPIPIGDRRRKRFTGRTKQLNTKVTPAFDAELRALAKARKIGIAEMLERMLVEWKALGGKGEPINA